ncbi:MAG: polyhydroxyalkanoate synthesis regulator DNA-binding domain-containing protein [Alphaproteobacteria bacterium]|nr:polyhydroxyalkanoate synthesis regulator DNA-binding domain-containing protein [Alphaproteobacteria bacterium]
MTELGEVGRPSVVIRKYANRRLYDTSASRYVTLADVAGMVADGTRVRVVTAAEEDDITRQVLAQIIFEDQDGDGMLDEVVLTRLIQLRRHPERGLLSRHITGALDSFPRPTGRKADVVPIDRRSRRSHDRARAEARIDALQRRLKRLIDEADKGDT